MRAALALARRGLGRTAPNPSVGCILVNRGRAVGRGWTQPEGRPHAEAEALMRAGEAARGATAYVTLEPCAHHGKTPPCAEALIAAGVARCVVAAADPDTRVAGKGLELLRAAGIEIETGVLSEEAGRVNEGHFLCRREGRPLVSLKLATTLDGRIATASGESRWITGPVARARGHLLRAEHDAVLVGSGTALADDPQLDVRLPGLEERKPLRVVLDRRLRLTASHRLAATAQAHPTLLITASGHADAEVAPLRAAGVEIAELPGAALVEDALRALAARGITRVLAEGGAELAAALLRAGCVDHLYWFRAARLLGAEGRPAVAELGIEKLAEIRCFRRLSCEALGADQLERYVLESAGPAD